MMVSARSKENYQVEVSAGKHIFICDEPLGIGDDQGPTPFDYLLGSIASCMIITMKMYAARKKWNVETINLSCDINSTDIIGSDDQKFRKSIIEFKINVGGKLTSQQQDRLIEIAGRCPVHRVLKGVIEYHIMLVE